MACVPFRKAALRDAARGIRALARTNDASAMGRGKDASR